MAKIDYEINASNAMNQVVLNVKLNGLNVFKCRVFIGIQLIKLAAKILNCGLEITTQEKGE